MIRSAEVLLNYTVRAVYRGIDSEKPLGPRPEIEKMISFYSWMGPLIVRSAGLSGVIMYSGPGEKPYQTLLTQQGRSRVARDVAQHYLEVRTEIDPAARDRVDSLVELMGQSSLARSPLLLLVKPYEVFNGQVVDGFHRLLAYLVSQSLTGKDEGVKVYWGYDTTPLITRLRWLRNELRRRELVRKGVLVNERIH